MRRRAAALVVLALAGSTSAGAADREPVLAVAGDTLLRVDPVTLTPSGKERLRLSASAVSAAARSPDGSKLALSARLAQLTIVDLRGLRQLAAIELPDVDVTAAIAWPAPRRVVVVRQNLRFRSGPLDRAALTVVDPVAARVVSHRRLRWAVLDARSTAAGVVLLLQRPAGIGAAVLALADADGRMRTVALTGIRAGERTEEGQNYWSIVRDEQPALALDASAGRAFVVGRDAFAEVELGTLRARTHALPLRRPAKSGPLPGWERGAASLGDGRVAVWGSDSDGKRSTATGLHVLDTRSGRLRRVDAPDSAHYGVVGGLLLAYGGIGDVAVRGGDVLGLTAYDAAGRLRFRALPDERAYVAETSGRYAYVYRREASGRKLRSVVDLRTGAVVRTEQHVWRMPHLLF